MRHLHPPFGRRVDAGALWPLNKKAGKRRVNFACGAVIPEPSNLGCKDVSAQSQFGADFIRLEMIAAQRAFRRTKPDEFSVQPKSITAVCTDMDLHTGTPRRGIERATRA